MWLFAYLPLALTCTIIAVDFLIYRMLRHPFHFWSIMLELAFLPVMFGLGSWIYLDSPAWSGYLICGGGSLVSIFYYMSMREYHRSLLGKESRPPVEFEGEMGANLFFTNALAAEAGKLAGWTTVESVLQDIIRRWGKESEWGFDDRRLVPLGSPADTRESLMMLEEMNAAVAKLMKGFVAEQKLAETVSDLMRATVRRYPGHLPGIGRMAEEVQLPLWLQVLRPGRSFLLETEDASEAFKILEQIANAGVPSVCVTIATPGSVRAVYRLGDTPILWISKQGEPAASPDDLEILQREIHSLSEGREVILFDGFEILVRFNGFERAIRFLRNIVERAAVRRKIVVIPVNPAALERKQIHMIRLMTEPLYLRTGATG